MLVELYKVSQDQGILYVINKYFKGFYALILAINFPMSGTINLANHSFLEKS